MEEEIERIEDDHETEENKEKWGGMDASELVKELLNNDHIEPYIRKKWWVLFSNTPKLSFVDEKAYKELMLEFEQLKINTIFAVPKAQYNNELEDLLIQIKMEFQMNLRRAMGNGRLNERELLGSQTKTTFRSRDIDVSEDQGSFGSRLRKMITGR